MSPELEILAIAVVTAVACALPGSFLVLRRMAMTSDAISHAILPGIVVAFLLTGELSSPLLMIAASATGVLTVALIEGLSRTRLVGEDAAIGIAFPALFSLGVILISAAASDVHLDTDVVLLGELAFAPFDRLSVAGLDLGPKALVSMLVILALNLLLVVAAGKELELATLDEELAAALGFSPAIVHYGLMTAVSLTAVGAFNAVGSILVVALMIAPPATAWLLTDRLRSMLWLSAVVAALGAALGYGVAWLTDVSIAGAMASTAGALFALVLLAAPERGLLAQARRRGRQRLEFHSRMLVVHLLHHAGGPGEVRENRLDGLHRHLRWSPSTTRQVVRHAEQRGLVEGRDALLQLTDHGRVLAQCAVSGEPLADSARAARRTLSTPRS
jgi:manganese/zinc/iron transport system permease protein